MDERAAPGQRRAGSIAGTLARLYQARDRLLRALDFALMPAEAAERAALLAALEQLIMEAEGLLARAGEAAERRWPTDR